MMMAAWQNILISPPMTASSCPIRFLWIPSAWQNRHQQDREFKWAVQYLADGRVNPEPMVTSRIYIEDAVVDGFEKEITDRNQIKILVTPDKKYLNS